MEAKHNICYVFIATIYAVLSGVVFFEYANFVPTACYFALSCAYLRLAFPRRPRL